MHDIGTRSPEPISTKPKSITVGNGRPLATALAKVDLYQMFCK